MSRVAVGPLGAVDIGYCGYVGYIPGQGVRSGSRFGYCGYIGHVLDGAQSTKRYNSRAHLLLRSWCVTDVTRLRNSSAHF